MRIEICHVGPYSPPSSSPQCATLARGRADAAASAIRRALDEAAPEGPLGEWERMLMHARRAELLSAYVEIELARGDTTSAQEAASELARAADALAALPVKALADRAAGAVLIAAGEPHMALAPLRRSWAAIGTKTWRRCRIRPSAAVPLH